MFFVIFVRRFHAIKYSSLVSRQQRSNPHGAKVMRLCVQKKDEGRGRCVSWNGVHAGEYER